MLRVLYWTVAPYLVGHIPALLRPPAAWAERPWWPYTRGAFEFVIGALAVSFMAGYSPWSQMLVATAVTAGRQWPLLARDPSCRALLIGLGAIFAINPISLALWGLLWAVAFVGTGFRTAAAAVATLALPIALGIVAGWAFGGMSLPVCLLILDRQRADLRRMFLGGEARHLWRPEG